MQIAFNHEDLLIFLFGPVICTLLSVFVFEKVLRLRLPGKKDSLVKLDPFFEPERANEFDSRLPCLDG